MSTPKSLRGLFCIVDPTGHPIHTHLGTKAEEIIESYLEQERMILGTILGRIAPSWEVMEAEGYTIAQMDLVPSVQPLLLATTP